MKAIAIGLTLSISLFVSDSAPSMSGIKINDPASALKSIKLEVVADDKESKTPMVKYRTENGNDFSVTMRKGKVIYLENDWLHEEKGKTPLLTKFTFGETSLKDIRVTFGTNGFTHTDFSYVKNKTHLIMFNCFEVDSPGNEILVTITRVSLTEEINESNIAGKLKLDAVILAEAKYLDEIWGKEKAYDTNYKKIKL